MALKLIIMAKINSNCIRNENKLKRSQSYILITSVPWYPSYYNVDNEIKTHTSWNIEQKECFYIAKELWQLHYNLRGVESNYHPLGIARWKKAFFMLIVEVFLMDEGGKWEWKMCYLSMFICKCDL